MKIQIASDLHLEFYDFKSQKENIIKKLKYNSDDAEVLVLAGDITTFENLDDLFLFEKYYENIVYVNGNHEVWGTTLENLHKHIRLMPKNFHWLENKSIIINNVNFIGCTLWFKRTEFNNKDLQWSDYKYMSADNKVNREEIFAANKISKEYLKSNIPENSFVITHHLPHKNSVAPRFKNDPFNDYFLCDMEEVILNNMPRYWVHGHSHDQFDYNINNTRIICNPLGYPHEPSINLFNWNKIVEIKWNT